MSFIDILVTCPDRATAEAIARACVKERLAACANIAEGVMLSIYRWKGALESSEETSLHLKTRADLFDAVAARVKAMHPYETPCIVAAPLDCVEPGYAAWLRAETAG